MSERTEITKICSELAELFEYKNEKYNNTASNPIHIFSRLTPEEGIKVRIDDKLSRVVNSSELRKNDTVDLIGYLVRLCIEKGWTDYKELYD